ncbi:hypothetical protein LCGC14_0930500 [marine sediment metagenome]|uniref:Uncharacterized protein n=1 Tax=marine sediment metagenome TaxID=412755 RepID=A0A0F9NSN1_9ZZZZ
MKDKEILKNNKLIAEFMGYRDGHAPCFFTNPYKCTCDYHKTHGEYDDDDEEDDEPKYNSSWDWLMPVVEKIEKLGVSTNIHYYSGVKVSEFTMDIPKRLSIEGHGSSFLGYKMEYGNSNNSKQTKIEAVYEIVIKFIKWYNDEERIEEEIEAGRRSNEGKNS